MWLWWTISMILVCGCIIYALYILVTSRNMHKAISSGVVKNKKFVSAAREFIIPQQLQSNSNANQSPAEPPSVYLSQINNLQQRLQVLENEVAYKRTESKPKQDETNWQQLYQDVHSAKLKLEDDLRYMQETIEATEIKISELIRNQRDAVELESNLDARLNEIQSLQNMIGELQQKLEGASNREKELEEELAENKKLVHEYFSLQQQHTHLQSEADELRNRMQELNSRNALLQQKVTHLSELESNLESFEYEKTEIKNTLEEIISENSTLSSKLHDLQEKLAAEKYAG